MGALGPHLTDCEIVLSQIKHQDKQLRLKRRFVSFCKSSGCLILSSSRPNPSCVHFFWVDDVPSRPVVEFMLEPSGVVEISRMASFFAAGDLLQSR